MKLTIKVDEEQAQYIAALLSFWKIYESDDSFSEIETDYAVRLLPALLMNIFILINSIPGFWEGLPSFAVGHGWTNEECALLLRLKDDTEIRLLAEKAEHGSIVRSA